MALIGDTEPACKELPRIRKFPVVEIFGPTIQGEGALVGATTLFVRFGGCGYRCSWCDSMHAVDPVQIKLHARQLSVHEIAIELMDLSEAQWITLSGGDPAMWDLTDLIVEMHRRHQDVAVETQGQFNPEWLRTVDLLTISPKPPSSGMAGKFDAFVLSQIIEGRAYLPPTSTVLKIVIFDEEDFRWAEHIHKSYPHVPMYLTPGTPAQTDIEYPTMLEAQILQKTEEVVGWVLKRPQMYKVRVIPQLHALLWGHTKGV